MTAAVMCFLTLTLPSDTDTDTDTDADIDTGRTKQHIDRSGECSPGKGSAVESSEGNEGLGSSLQFLMSVPLCCLFLGSMGSFFLQRGLSDWAGV